MNGDNINYMLLNYFVHGIDGMKMVLLHYISCNISHIHININIKYLIIHFIVISYLFLDMQSH
jgi:succinate dehydrogenase hydrophobic anchor subunit